MKMRFAISAAVVALALAILPAIGATAGPRTGTKTGGSKDSSAPAPATANPAQDENLHLEGEKRFRSNCSRCHAAPPKFAPRMMSTIVRHMRVRANITNEDMRLILRYMSE
ncbi:MAG TPA: cytochrome c [Candidatus Angelobacter sp.]|nr:cytochrome c [Candidatus Angelobacter sp.]